MSARDELVERNVARLLDRAYRPVVPAESFRRELLRRVASPLAASTPRARARPRWAVGLAALAAMLLASWALWQRFAGEAAAPGPESLEAILARGAVALDEGGGWRALEPIDGLAHHALARRARLATPEDAAVEVALEAGGSISLRGGSAAALAPEGAAGFGLFGELERGELLAEHPGAGARWRLELECDASQRRAALELERGTLGLVAATATACARARLDGQGRADLVVDTWRDALAPGGTRELCAAGLVATPAAGGERKPLGAPPEASAAAPAAPLAPGDVGGEVVDAASGEPLAEFTVVLAPLLSLPRPREPRVERFERAGGRFEIADVRPGEYVVWVGARGYAYFASDVVALGAEPFRVRAELSAGTALAGRVVERATGLPIPGASVISEGDVPASMIDLRLDESHARWIAVAKSDGRGRFVLEHLRSGSTRLRVNAPGFAPAWLACDGSASEVEVSLTPAATLAGRVEANDGTPQAEHALVVVPMDASQYPLYWSHVVITDERGEFRATDLPAIQCVVVHLGSLRDQRNWSPAPAVRYATLAAGEERRADFTAPERGARLFGRLLDPEGNPVGGRSLTVVPAGTAVEDPTAWRVAGVEADGRYDIRGLAPGTYEVYVSARSPTEVLHQDVVTLERNRELELDVHLGAGSVRGRARSAATGAPVGQVVWVLLRTDDGSDAFAARVIGASDGTFEIPSLPDGVYRLIGLPQDGSHAFAVREGLAVSAGSALGPLELEFERGANVVVRVHDGLGAPVSGAEVRVLDAAGVDLKLTELQCTDTQGRLELLGLPAGRYRFEARAGELASEPREVDLAVGDSPSIELALAPR